MSSEVAALLIAAACLLAACLLSCASHLADPPIRAQGHEVRVVHGAELPGLARASWEPQGPVVYLSSELEEHSPVFQWWALAHEVCHLDGERTETGADCCALRWCVDALGYDDEELAKIATALGSTPRIVSLFQCAAKVMP